MRKTPATHALGAAQRRLHGPIIVAVGEAGGMVAVRIARQLARRAGAELVVASVVEPPGLYDVGSRKVLFVPSTVDGEIEARRESVAGRLHRLRHASELGDTFTPPQVEVSYGDAATHIAGMARDRHARLIVMGMGRHPVARRLLSPGTPWETSRNATCPVLAVDERARDVPRHAVIATDFSAESIHAAQQALPLLADGATVHIVHVWSRFETVFPVSALARLNDDYAASLPERFARLRAAIGHSGSFVFRESVAHGSPADAVLTLAEAGQADLIVAGTHGFGMLGQWALGSTSTAIIRSAKCSVLLVPPPPAAVRAQLERHMTGTTRLANSDEWDEELRAFVERNRERSTRLEMDDPGIGAQVQESGYVLVGASYDRHDEHVALMFGGDGSGAPHLTRSLGGVRSVAVTSGTQDDDVALCIESDAGRALLTFTERAFAKRTSIA
ncbi:MAG: universal stress protein [Gemmatimonadaceae bacterium]